MCGMLTASGVSGIWHHSRAHWFFAATGWSPDQLGLTMLRLIVGWLLPVDAPIVIAVDATLFRRSGRKVHAACCVRRSRQVAKGQEELSERSGYAEFEHMFEWWRTRPF
ncbi:MAG TPA: transposase [Pseudonocardiaceae bacterium]|nr:transposase [Pseudonocardiaceae bacterium]